MCSPRRNEQKPNDVEFCVRKRHSVEFNWNSARRQQRSLAESGKVRSSQKNFMSSHSMISASAIYKNDRRCKTGHYRTYKNEFVESSGTKLDCEGNLFRKEKALRETQIRSKHEMEKMKRAQVQQVDEKSVNHETIQQLTSQLQQVQEQMNPMHSLGESQDIESKL